MKAAKIGFRDIDEGRYDDIRDEDLECFIGELGTRAQQQLRGNAASAGSHTFPERPRRVEE